MDCENLYNSCINIGSAGFQATFFVTCNIEPLKECRQCSTATCKFCSFIHKAIKVASSASSAIAQHDFAFKVEIALDINDEIGNRSRCTRAKASQVRCEFGKSFITFAAEFSFIALINLIECINDASDKLIICFSRERITGHNIFNDATAIGCKRF